MILDIYAAINSHPLSPKQFDIMTQGINSIKLEEIYSKKNKTDADNTIIGINLVRAGISKTFALPIQEIKLMYTPTGKPYIYGRSDIHVNITHSKNLIACAVSDEQVGIDAEMVRDFDLKLAKKYFTPKEIKLIENATDKNKMFASIWTKKEAALKCSGIGISGLSDKALFDDYNYDTLEFEQYIISTATKKKEL